MRGQISRWGNSLALRIPRHVAREIAVNEGEAVEISVQAERIIISPICAEPSYDLDELLSQVTDENRHDEVQWGKAVGNEFA